MNATKGNDMNRSNVKGYLTLKEALQDPEVTNVRLPVKTHPKPWVNEDCLYHGLLGMANVSSLVEECWQIVDEGDRWALWFVPQNHPERWTELASFSTRPEAMEFLDSL